MKKIFIVMFAAAAVLAGCNKTEIENGGGMGTLKFSLNPSVDDSYNEKGEGMLGGSSSQRAATKAVPIQLLQFHPVTIRLPHGTSLYMEVLKSSASSPEAHPLWNLSAR